MRPVSDAYLSTVASSHAMTVDARILATYQEGTDPDGTEVEVVDGTVTLSATADNRSIVDMTVVGTWPTVSDDLLAPYGNDVFVRRGVEYGNGTTEWVSLGYFQLKAVDQQDAPKGTIRLQGFDRNRGLIRARLLSPVQFSADETFEDVVGALVYDVYPDATIEWDDTTGTEVLGRAVLAEQDRFGGLRDLIGSRGKIAYWDHRGVLVIKDLPDTATPVVTVNAGEGGVRIALARTLTSEGVYNAVVASGESTDDHAPVHAVAVDNDPRSPTYFYGRFGQCPEFYSSPLLQTNGQAYRAARTILLKKLGLPYTIDFQMVPNPSLEPYDPVRVPAEADEIQVLDTLTVPLGNTSMRGTSRGLTGGTQVSLI